jgi:hypothetical protein
MNTVHVYEMTGTEALILILSLTIGAGLCYLLGVKLDKRRK